MITTSDDDKYDQMEMFASSGALHQVSQYAFTQNDEQLQNSLHHTCKKRWRKYFKKIKALKRWENKKAV